MALSYTHFLLFVKAIFVKRCPLIGLVAKKGYHKTRHNVRIPNTYVFKK